MQNTCKGKEVDQFSLMYD